VLPGVAFGDFVVFGSPATRGATLLAAARHPSGRVVDIKVLAPNLAGEPVIRDRFVGEARVLTMITSRHSVAAIDFGKTEAEVLYLVLEHFDGENLADRLVRRGPLAVTDAVSYVQQACDAVAEANDQGFVHGDLNPGSLLLVMDAAKQPRIIVRDFGLTRPFLPWIGPCAAPEQIRGEEADARTDVWGLGATLYMLLAGDLAHAPDLRSQRRDLPPGLHAVVAKCLDGDKDARFANARELSRALRLYSTNPGRGVRDREVRLVWSARDHIAKLVTSGLTMDAVKTEMERWIVWPLAIDPNVLTTIASKWDLPLWALQAVAHEAEEADGVPTAETPFVPDAQPAIASDDVAANASQAETPAPDALRAAAVAKALTKAKRDGES
jgi:serine/threonine protein kinase